MNKQTRTKNSIRNIIFSLVGQVIALMVNFISRTVFINILGMEYLGLSGLFTNILTVLSLAELGIGSAIIYSLYKPLAIEDKKKIKALMRLYERSYRTIGIVVAVLGVLLIPFLDIFIKNDTNVPEHIPYIYLLFLANSVSTYFFAYKRSIIIADQKKYIDIINKYTFFIVLNIIQILILLFTKNYILFLVSQIIFSLLENYSISRMVNKLYPYLKGPNIECLDKNSINEVRKNIFAMTAHKVGGVVVNGTDNILISTFIGLNMVGLFSNYILIVTAVNSMLNQLFTAITASVGNLNATESKEKSHQVFCNMQFLNFWVYAFSSICLYQLLNPFITLWLGIKFTLEMSIVVIIVTNFYLNGMRASVNSFKITYGLFWNDRFKPIFEAIINFGTSIILLRYLGISGVLIGTFISGISTNFWIEPYVLYKHGFQKRMKGYFSKYIIYTLSALLINYATSRLIVYLDLAITISFVERFMICFVIPNILFIILYHRTKEFKYFYSICKREIIKKLAPRK